MGVVKRLIDFEPGYVRGEPFEGVEYENRPQAGPAVRKRDWVAGWDREQREHLLIHSFLRPLPLPISWFE